MKKKKKILVISFTKQGSRRNREIGEKMTAAGYDCECYTVQRFADCKADGQENAEETMSEKDRIRLLSLPEKENRSEWIGQYWGEAVFLFIGAAGIAVRWIAPWVKDKFTDSAVIVMDEKAEYVIPLLSGHVGGAVEFARKIAGCTGAVPVITTATDVERVFAVDVFASENSCRITDRTAAKQISAALLEGKNIGFYSEYSWEGELPRQLVLCKSKSDLETFAERQGGGIWISRKTEDCGAKILQLIPQNLAVGIGCRKGIEEAALAGGLREILEGHGCRMEQVASLSSISLKQEEAGILNLAEKLQVPFRCYSPEELQRTGAVEKTSEFVRTVTGVDNVCERAARAAAPNGTVVFGKNCRKGMTAAAVEKETVLKFR